jgi:hypothetical protein
MGGVAPASSEFGRVLWFLLRISYLSLLLLVRFTARVKQMELRGEAPG